jgi:hypothetical protein
VSHLPSALRRPEWAAGAFVLAAILAIASFSIHQAVAANPVIHGEAYVLQGRFGDDPAVRTVALAGVNGPGQLNIVNAQPLVRWPLVTAPGSDAGPGWDVGFVSGGRFDPQHPDSDALAGCQGANDGALCVAFSIFAAMGVVPTGDDDLENGLGIWGAWFMGVASITALTGSGPENNLLMILEEFCLFDPDEEGPGDDCIEDPVGVSSSGNPAAPLVIDVNTPFEGGTVLGTITLNIQAKYSTLAGAPGAGGRIIAIAVDNLRYEKGSNSWHLFTGTVLSADTFMAAGRGPTIEFFPEKLLPDGRWVPYSGEWHNGIVRVRVVCTPGDFPIKSDSTPARYWFEQDGEVTVPAGAVAGSKCRDTAGNIAESGPPNPIVTRVDRRAPRCTVTPSPSAFSRTTAVQTINVTVNPGSAPAPAVKTWLVSVTGGVAGDRIGWTIGTADFQGQLKGGGRKTYTLTYAVEDAAGNVGTCSALVKVT